MTCEEELQDKDIDRPYKPISGLFGGYFRAILDYFECDFRTILSAISGIKMCKPSQSVINEAYPGVEVKIECSPL